MDLQNLKPAEMEIKVLGTGCKKCANLEKATREAVAELGVNASIEKVEDIRVIMEMGVMQTPGLVVNGKVVSTGKVPKVSEIKSLITENK